jgi:hypothetical protein
MGAGRDGAADFVQMLLHGLGVGIGHDEGCSCAAARADRAEQIGVLVTLVLGLARPAPLLGPLINKAVLLPNPHLVLEPDLNGRLRRKLPHRHSGDGGKVFLKAAIAPLSCAGCCGLALICE